MPGPGAPRQSHARRLALVVVLLALYVALAVAGIVALLGAGR